MSRRFPLLALAVVLASVVWCAAPSSGQEQEGKTLTAEQAQQPSQRVEYFTDAIVEIDKEYLELLGGTEWMLDLEPLLLLPYTEVIVVFEHAEPEFATVYAEGESYVGALLKGQVIKQTGIRTSVVDEFGDGAVLETADGSLWSVPDYDRYDTGYWLPPYPVLITSDELYMYNLDQGKRVWVEREK